MIHDDVLQPVEEPGLFQGAVVTAAADVTVTVEVDVEVDVVEVDECAARDDGVDHRRPR